MGGQPGNMNASKHGRRSDRMGMVVASLARHHRGIQGDLHLMRRGLEKQARQSLGLDGNLPALINSGIALVVSNHRLARQAQRRAAEISLDDPDRAIQLEQTAIKALQDAHETLRRLGIDAAAGDGDGDPWAALYALTPQQAAQGPEGEPNPEHSGNGKDATAATLGDVGGQQ